MKIPKTKLNEKKMRKRIELSIDVVIAALEEDMYGKEL
jgi:hypothetical protein